VGIAPRSGLKLLLALAIPGTLASQNASVLYRDGLRLVGERKMGDAIAALRQSVALDPAFAPAWKALGVALASGGEIENAETAFRNACTRQPDLPDACLYYGRTLYLLNQFEPAVDVLRRAPESAESHRLLALSLQALDRMPEAADHFRAAIRLSRNAPPDEDPGIDYAVYLFRLGQAEKAIEPVQSALQRHPESGRAHLELGCILLALDRLEDAAAHLERAVALTPQSSRARLLLGKVYLRLGKTEAAEEHLRQGSRAK
jgi:tetratricopeptide (TPR) repeat protein